MNVDGAVRLHDPTDIDFKKLRTVADCAAAAKDPETVLKLEELVTCWRKQIEQVFCLFVSQKVYIGIFF